MDSEDEILLQGVVDCCIEEHGELTVIDYKTDYVNQKTLHARAALYTPQLRAYASAMERITGKPVRQGILAYKFRNAPSRGKVFGRILGEDLLRRGADDFDLISWVPLSAKRCHRRGYDQAQLLAEAAAEALGTKAVPLLRKARDVSPQSRLRTPEERRANISGCYVVRSADAVRGKRILLIDDVITTGSTLSECARMLLTAGAVSVRGAALACHREE